MRVFVAAGEPSGDRLGAALIAGLRTLDPSLRIAGVGGPAMQAEGLQSLFPMHELSVMGLTEVLPKYRQLKRRIAQTAQAAVAFGADAVVTIDSPDFALRVQRLVQAAGAPARRVHYVAPSVWAWRSGRAVRMARVIEHVLAILPFEPPLMQAAGMSCDFVGHPVVAEPLASRDEIAALRASLGPGPLLLCLPGSRRGEVTRLSARFGAALALVADRLGGANIVLPVVPHLGQTIMQLTANWPVQPRLIMDAAEKRAAFSAADVALAASGTVSLELAANGVPMVIGYDAAPLTRMIVQAMLKVDTVTLVNLVSGSRSVPEFIGPRMTPGALADALLPLLGNPSARAPQLSAMALTMQRLGRGGEPPGLRAARSVIAAVRAPR